MGQKKKSRLGSHSALNNPSAGIYRHLFLYSPVAIWAEDFSAFARLLEKLRRQKVANFKKYFSEHTDIVRKTFRKVEIIDVNEAALALYGAKTQRELISKLDRTFTKDAVRILAEEFTALAEGNRSFEAGFKSRMLDGKLCDVLLKVFVPAGYEKTFTRVYVTIQDVSEQKRLERHLKRVARQDSLTGLLNSRAISQRLEEELIRSRRYHSDLSCMMLDVDYFKTINDRFGHQRGDQILKRVAKTIKGCLRRSDIVGRYGGDEFFVILTETKSQNAKVAAERVRQLIASLAFTSSSRVPLKLRISIGISGFPSEKVKSFKDLISIADQALYQAKKAGRDRVVLAEEPA